MVVLNALELELYYGVLGAEIISTKISVHFQFYEGSDHPKKFKVYSFRYEGVWELQISGLSVQGKGCTARVLQGSYGFDG